jgi:hypothetical protein
MLIVSHVLDPIFTIDIHHTLHFMPLHTIVPSSKRLDELVDAIYLGESSQFHQENGATLRTYEQATRLIEVRHEMLGMVCFRISRTISDYSLICSRARLSSLH